MCVSKLHQPQVKSSQLFELPLGGDERQVIYYSALVTWLLAVETCILTDDTSLNDYHVHKSTCSSTCITNTF